MRTVSTMTYTTAEALFPIGDTARQLGVSIDTVRRWERDGKISGVRTVGNQRRFPRSEIDRLLNRVSETAPAA